MSMIVIEDVARAFGSVRAVDGLSLTVEHGQIYGLIGPDGAGKTTTLRMLCGLLLPDRGVLRLGDIDVRRDPEGVRRQIGYMPQRFSLYGDLTVAENMRFFADSYGVPSADRPALMAKLLSFSRLEPFQARRAEALSGGMKQKLALACALIHRPAVLLLDEPTTGVDPVARREFWSILREAARTDGMTVLVSTPYMDEADRCHVVGFMRDGKMMAAGRPHDLQKLVPGAVMEVSATPLRQAERALHDLAGVRDVQVLGDRIHVLADTAPDHAALAQQLGAAGVTLHSARQVVPTMENVFMYLQRGGRPKEASSGNELRG